MSNGKGKEVSKKQDWKEKLAMLDQEVGWDEASDSDWAEDCETEKEKVCISPKPPRGGHIKWNQADIQQSTEQGEEKYFPSESQAALGATTTDKDYAACYRAQLYADSSSDYSDSESSNDSDNEENMPSQLQGTTWETLCEMCGGKKDWNEGIMYDLYHRSGTGLDFETRCACHQYLRDDEELGRIRRRERFAQADSPVLIKDPCILLPYPQNALPGTEEVDKPILMVMTPERVSLYPHDNEEYPEPTTPSRHGSKSGWGERGPAGRYMVAYEDEDTPDD